MYTVKKMGLIKRVFDQDAWTIYDICAETGLGYIPASKLAKENMASGEWEKVWKRAKGSTRPVPAYRPIGAKP